MLYEKRITFSHAVTNDIFACHSGIHQNDALVISFIFN